MSAVHRVDDIHSMPAAQFFQRAWRLPHYRGVMRDRVIALQQEQDTGGSPEPVGRPEPRQRNAAARDPEPVTKDALSDPVMSRIFSFG